MNDATWKVTEFLALNEDETDIDWDRTDQNVNAWFTTHESDITAKEMRSWLRKIITKHGIQKTISLLKHYGQ